MSHRMMSGRRYCQRREVKLRMSVTSSQGLRYLAAGPAGWGLPPVIMQQLHHKNAILPLETGYIAHTI